MCRGLVFFSFFLWGCTREVTYPGDTLLGTFQFRATGIDAACASEVPQEFSFLATFSASEDSSEVWMTLGDVSERVTFDGQRLTSVRSADRVFPLQCRENALCVDTSVKEMLDVVFLSKSQDEAIPGEGCPEDALNNLPPVNPDAGVFGPGLTPRGFDAVRACGTLSNEVIAVSKSSSCQGCKSCSMTYSVSGERR